MSSPWSLFQSPKLLSMDRRIKRTKKAALSERPAFSISVVLTPILQCKNRDFVISTRPVFGSIITGKGGQSEQFCIDYSETIFSKKREATPAKYPQNSPLTTLWSSLQCDSFLINTPDHLKAMTHLTIIEFTSLETFADGFRTNELLHIHVSHGVLCTAAGLNICL